MNTFKAVAISLSLSLASLAFATRGFAAPEAPTQTCADDGCVTVGIRG